MTAKVQRGEMKLIHATCAVKPVDGIQIDEFNDETCVVTVTDTSYSESREASMYLTKNDARIVAAALLEWANS